MACRKKNRKLTPQLHPENQSTREKFTLASRFKMLRNKNFSLPSSRKAKKYDKNVSDKLAPP